MSLLENSVRALATALENLENRIDTRIESGIDSPDHERDHQAVQSLRHQADTARHSARTTANELSAIIAEAKSLLTKEKE